MHQTLRVTPAMEAGIADRVWSIDEIVGLLGFLINLGVAANGKDCEAVGAQHHWYNRDNKTSGCYHYEAIRSGQLWRRR